MPSPWGTDVLSMLPYGNWSKECLKIKLVRESASDVGWVSWSRRERRRKVVGVIAKAGRWQQPARGIAGDLMVSLDDTFSLASRWGPIPPALVSFLCVLRL